MRSVNSRRWILVATASALGCAALPLTVAVVPARVHAQQANERANSPWGNPYWDQTARATEIGATSNESELVTIRDEMRLLRRDVARLIELLESRSAQAPVRQGRDQARRPRFERLERSRAKPAIRGVFAVTYQVADLVIPIRKLVTVTAGPQGLGVLTEDSPATGKNRLDRAAGPPELDKVSIAKADFGPLLELITSSIAPGSWEAAGGEASIAVFRENLSIVVRQTQEIHKEIADLLGQLRRSQDRQIVLDSTIIAIAGDALAGMTVPADGEALVVEPALGNTLRVLASSLQDQQVQGAPKASLRSLGKLTLFPGQSAKFEMTRPEGGMEVLVHTVLGEQTGTVQLAFAVNAQDVADALRTSTSVNVPDGQTVLVDITSRLSGKERGDLLSVAPQLQSALRRAHGSPSDQSARTFLLVNPRIIVEEQLEEDRGVPPSP